MSAATVHPGIGFVGVDNFTTGGKPDEQEIADRLDQLAKKLHLTIYGISGYRTPQHSVEVGGFADDPHTQGAAIDIGVNSQMRSSAGALTEKQLESVGLTRPFGGPGEINHIQLLSKPSSSSSSSTEGGVLGFHSFGDFLGQVFNPFHTNPNYGRSPAGTAEAGLSYVAREAEKGAVAGVSSIFGGWFSTVEQGALKAVLYAVLILGAIGVIGYGTARLFGVQQPAKSAVKGAAVVAK